VKDSDGVITGEIQINVSRSPNSVTDVQKALDKLAAEYREILLIIWLTK
jgi:hypothetical protein